MFTRRISEWWAGGGSLPSSSTSSPASNSTNNETSIGYENLFSEKVIKATEFLFNFTNLRDANFTSASENIKLLAPLNNNSVYGNFSADQNISNYEPRIPEYIRTTSIVFCVVILFFGLIGNIMVPIVILKTKDMRNSTNIFLINLSVADLLVLLICTPTVLVEVNSVPETWALGEHMCKLVPFIELTVAHASILTILAISFERYYAICEPLKAGYVCTKTRAMIICVVCWFVAGLFTSPILEIANFHMEEYYDGSIVAVCLTTVETFWPSFFFIASITIFFLVPLLILIVLYSVIAKHLMVNPTLISAQGNRSNFIKYRKQVILMLAAVVISFFTCLLPFRAFTLWIILVPSETIMSLLSSERGIEVYYSVLYFCRCMWYLNSAMNPVLYNLMSSKFREGFVRLLGCKPLMRTTSWSDSARKGTFHTASTNLSSSNHHGNVGNSIEAHRLKIANLEVENLTTIERAPLNVIKYVKIVIEEKVECLDAEVGSDCEAEYEIIEDNQIDTKASENNVNNADNLNLSINSYPNKQKSNYKTKENVKISIKSHSNDKCSSADDEIDCDSNQEDFCINIYNLLSAKESLV